MGTQNQRLKGTNPRGIHVLKPPKKSYQGSTYTDTPSSARMRMKTPGTLDCVSIRTRPARREVSTLENLQLAQTGVRSVDPLTHLLTDKAFNVTTSTYVATAPPAWEQHPCLILLFTVHPGMDDKKAATIHTTSSTILPLTPPRGTRRQPPRLGFLGLSIILSSSTPSATF
jgi:hypothetical protein